MNKSKNIILNHLKPLLNDDERYEVETSRNEKVVSIVHVDSVGKRMPLVEIVYAPESDCLIVEELL